MTFLPPSMIQWIWNLITDSVFLCFQIEPLLTEYLDKEFEIGKWTANTKQITNSWIRDGLKPRCITRDLKWGTPVPMPGYTDKVTTPILLTWLIVSLQQTRSQIDIFTDCVWKKNVIWLPYRLITCLWKEQIIFIVKPDHHRITCVSRSHTITAWFYPCNYVVFFLISL